VIETPRLVLRSFALHDGAAMWAQVQDPAVMRFLLPVPDIAAFVAMVGRMQGYERDHGYTFWTIERRADGAMLGVCGLKPGAPETPIAGEVEIGWRLGREFWGQGYAREAAQATLDWAWASLDTPHVYAITVADNAASWGLMERLGMARVADGDFDHPAVPDDRPLKRHILYRIDRPAA
jgi:RimJ/RimL family protein N-acetyltransferase